MGVALKPKHKAGWKEIAKAQMNFDVDACPCCKTGRMIRILTFEANAPPAYLLASLQPSASAMQ